MRIGVRGGRPPASGRPPGGLREASGRPPGEAAGRPPGGLREASGRPPGGLREASERPPGDTSKSTDSRGDLRGTKSPVVSCRVGPGRDGNGKLLQTPFPTRPRKNAVPGGSEPLTAINSANDNIIMANDEKLTPWLLLCTTLGKYANCGGDKQKRDFGLAKCVF